VGGINGEKKMKYGGIIWRKSIWSPVVDCQARRMEEKRCISCVNFATLHLPMEYPNVVTRIGQQITTAADQSSLSYKKLYVAVRQIEEKGGSVRFIKKDIVIECMKKIGSND
jgi:hypothetical protein